MEVMTIYVFSIENFKRPKEQVEDLMMLLEGVLSAFRLPDSLAQRRDIQVRVVGRTDLLESKIQNSIAYTMEATKKNRSGILNVCLAYTSRDEITTSIRQTVAQGILPHLITEQTLTDNMLVGYPPVDILIRTSRTYRLSDFMLWQCHQNTMIEIVGVNWPDFGIWKLFLTILKWQRGRAHENKEKQDAISSKGKSSGVRNGMFVIIFSPAYAVCALWRVLRDVLFSWCVCT
jgi:ditrans,polycis-polyprenyl diphosphate synthase